VANPGGLGSGELITFSCKNGEIIPCAPIFDPAGITTYTWRALTLNWVLQGEKLINTTLLITSISTEMMNDVVLNVDKYVAPVNTLV
jgi:hypothetical protein